MKQQILKSQDSLGKNDLMTDFFVCFHLAENKNNIEKPFAFMATYVKKVDNEQPTYVPLGRALKEYEGEKNKDHLLNLLKPIQKASDDIPFIKEMLDLKTLFHPQAWTAKQAYAFLNSLHLIENCGIRVKVPNWWKPKTPPRPKVDVTVGNKSANLVGLASLLDFNINYSLPNGETLTKKEFQMLMHSTQQLVQVRGQWIEVDTSKLSGVLHHWSGIERAVKHDGLSFAEGLRLIAGAPAKYQDNNISNDVHEWTTIKEGDFLKDALSKLRSPDIGTDKNVQNILEKDLDATLRPYQKSGVQWLWWLYTLRLGGCLADDMGLGKTMQIISLFLLIKNYDQESKNTNLLILPASLLGNWMAELNKFAPSLTVFVAHSSSHKNDILKTQKGPDLTNIDIVITTYGNVHRLPWIQEKKWHCAVLDEAQGIKNPNTKQTRSIKKLKSDINFVLTGTPIENKLLDLWSLFDFCAPGLLGSHKNFAQYGKKISAPEPDESLNELKKIQEEDGEKKFYSIVNKLVSPYILRRLKSDKSIISDLPDKTEVDNFCFLTKHQASCYEKVVLELKHKMEEGFYDNIARRGAVLSTMMRLKQICNHPTQWLGHGEYTKSKSGKFIELGKLGQQIFEANERVLIFTQYKEIIQPIHDFLKGIFKRDGLMLHGGTKIKDRQRLVDAFQKDDGPPFFVLSLKAGGTGLTLTKATQVIHFDRWWNPSVENQATDRAYRIGQKKNVLVHKFICQGTIEDKINDMINIKKTLASDILGQDDSQKITELGDSELLNMMTLDIHKAVGDTL